MPAVPAGSEVVVISSAAALMVMERSCEAAALLASATRAVKRNVPGVVGVPAMVAPVSERPGGSVPVVLQV